MTPFWNATRRHISASASATRSGSMRAMIAGQYSVPRLRRVCGRAVRPRGVARQGEGPPRDGSQADREH
eukprot:28271-Chlamydomonas_euryale.AAC.1